MPARTVIVLIVPAATLPAASAAAAAPFAPATPVPGFGSQPALAEISGAALAANVASVVAGTSESGGNRRAVAVLADGASAPSVARVFGPSSGAFDLALASNAAGDVAPTFTVGHTAYLATCHRGRCRPTVRVGRPSLKPQSAVAVQPDARRPIVLWRGRTSHGIDRPHWRITTNRKLGRIHTLCEFGNTPTLATDASGKTVAVRLDRRARRRGVRTAARCIGEFLAPTTISRSGAGELRLVTSDGGSSIAACLSAANRLDPEIPAGIIQVATRTRSTSFGAPRSLGAGSTLSLAGSPPGHAVLATDRHVAGRSVIAWTGPQGGQLAHAGA